jgi:hypothetical protein
LDLVSARPLLLVGRTLDARAGLIVLRHVPARVGLAEVAWVPGRLRQEQRPLLALHEVFVLLELAIDLHPVVLHRPADGHALVRDFQVVEPPGHVVGREHGVLILELPQVLDVLVLDVGVGGEYVPQDLVGTRRLVFEDVCELLLDGHGLLYLLDHRAAVCGFRLRLGFRFGFVVSPLLLQLAPVDPLVYRRPRVVYIVVFGNLTDCTVVFVQLDHPVYLLFGGWVVIDHATTCPPYRMIKPASDCGHGADTVLTGRV